MIMNDVRIFDRGRFAEALRGLATEAAALEGKS
jgi:hypothetical protein